MNVFEAFLLPSIGIGFLMGRAWERIVREPKNDDCPFGNECVYCHPTSANAASKVHMKTVLLG